MHCAFLLMRLRVGEWSGELMLWSEGAEGSRHSEGLEGGLEIGV